MFQTLVSQTELSIFIQVTPVLLCADGEEEEEEEAEADCEEQTQTEASVEIKTQRQSRGEETEAAQRMSATQWWKKSSTALTSNLRSS